MRRRSEGRRGRREFRGCLWTERFVCGLRKVTRVEGWKDLDEEGKETGAKGREEREAMHEEKKEVVEADELPRG